jgi:hypothetical protein
MAQLETAPYYRREHGENQKKSHPPSLEPPQLGFLGNFLGLLRVTECHRARAKNGWQRRPPPPPPPPPSPGSI